MSEDDIVNKYLEEIKAKNRSSSLNEFGQRINAEKAIRLILDEIKEEGISFNEILSMKEETHNTVKPDYILYKNDIKIPLFLRFYEKEKMVIEKNDFKKIINIFVDTDYVNIIITILKLNDFPSIYIKNTQYNDLKDIERYEFNESYSTNLKTIILDLFRDMDYRIPLNEIIIEDNFIIEDVLESFIIKCKAYINNSKNNASPRLDYRIDALKSINQKDINNLCQIMEDYLIGDIDEKKLENKLITMYKLGEQ